MSNKNLVGQKFGRWEVLYEVEPIQRKGYKEPCWYCRCECGTEKEIPEYRLTSGSSKSCGCLRKERCSASRFIDLTGQRFGRLIVTKQAESVRDNSNKLVTRWYCDCDCGNKNIIIRGSSLRSGITTSCGCYNKEKNREIMSRTMKKYNTYDLSGKYGIGYTEQGDTFYFDLEDYDLIKDYCWHVNDGGYMLTNTYNGETKERGQIRMHRLICNCVNNEEIVIDHINHNQVDNRKCNLRITTMKGNMKNQKLNIRNTSGTTGVVLDKRRNRWVAQIAVNGKNKYIMSSSNKEDAINARKDAEEKYYGEYSYDNSMKMAEQYNIEELN